MLLAGAGGINSLWLGRTQHRSVHGQLGADSTFLPRPDLAWSISVLKSDWPLPSWEWARERSGSTLPSKTTLATPTREQTSESSSRTVRLFESPSLDTRGPAPVRRTLLSDWDVTLVPVRERVATRQECPPRLCGCDVNESCDECCESTARLERLTSTCEWGAT